MQWWLCLASTSAVDSKLCKAEISTHSYPAMHGHEMHQSFGQPRLLSGPKLVRDMFSSFCSTQTRAKAHEQKKKMLQNLGDAACRMFRSEFSNAGSTKRIVIFCIGWVFLEAHRECTLTTARNEQMIPINDFYNIMEKPDFPNSLSCSWDQQDFALVRDKTLSEVMDHYGFSDAGIWKTIQLSDSRMLT